MSHSISIFCAINWALSITKKNPRIAGFYVSLMMEQRINSEV